MLYQRYSNPLMLLEQMVQTGRLSEFITEILEIRQKELNEKTMWEYYLHKIFDMSFADFMGQHKEPEVETIDNERMTEIVKDSLDILARQ